MPTNDFLPWATGGSANVLSQSAYAALAPTIIANGFAGGLAAVSNQFNKALRQPSFVAAAVAQFIANTLGVDVHDDGNLTAFATNLSSAVVAAGSSGAALYIGRVNGWVDTFFRNLPLSTTTLFGPPTSQKIRYGTPGTCTLTANTSNPYDGNILRVPAGQTPQLFVYPGEIPNTSIGSTPFSAAAVVLGAGDTALIALQFYNNVGGIIGSITFGGTAITSSTPQTIKVSAAWPVGAVSAAVLVADAVGSGHIDVCALWCGNFTTSTLPTTPGFEDDTFIADQVKSTAAAVAAGAFALPPTIYSTDGLELDIYWDNLTSGDWRDDAWVAYPTSAIGGTQNLFERFNWSAPVGAGSVGITINQVRKNDVSVKASGLVAATFSLSSAASGINRKQLWIGDSIVGVAYHLQRMADRAAQAGEVMGVTLSGSRNTAATYRLAVSGVTVAPVTGASLYQTAAGTWLLAVAQRLDSRGNGYLFFQYWLGGTSTTIPVATGGTITKVAGVGDSTITYSNSGSLSPTLVHHEGRGGWATSDFATVGRTFYKFTVSGVTVSPIGFTDVNQTNYTNNGSTFATRDVNISGGAGTLVMERIGGTNAPTASGTLTNTGVAPGDATIAFSAFVTQSGNPFWNPASGGALDLAFYFSTYGITPLGNNDWIFICLGYNDFIYLVNSGGVDAVTAQLPATLANIDALRTMVKNYNTAHSVNIKIGIVGEPMLAGSQDGYQIFAAAPAGTGGSVFRYQVKRSQALFLNALMAHTAGYSDASTVFAPMFHTGDTLNGYRFADPAPLCQDIPEIVIQRMNDIHPFVGAGFQHGDAMWSFMKAMA